MPERNTRIRIFIIILLIGIIAFFDYWTSMQHRRYHILYQGLFFLPVMLSGLWFGLRGALATSMGITLVLIPSIIIHWKGFSPDDFNGIVEMILYNLVGGTLGQLRNQRRVERKESEGIQKSGRHGESCIKPCS